MTQQGTPPQDNDHKPPKSRWIRLTLAVLLTACVIAYLVGWGLDTQSERVSLAIPFIFILFDYLAFELKIRDASSEKQELLYEPRLKIWGLGALLGLGFLLLSKWEKIIGTLGTEIAGTISKAALTLGIISLIVYGIVRVVRED